MKSKNVNTSKMEVNAKLFSLWAEVSGEPAPPLLRLWQSILPGVR